MERRGLYLCAIAVSKRGRLEPSGISAGLQLYGVHTMELPTTGHPSPIGSSSSVSRPDVVWHDNHVTREQRQERFSLFTADKTMLS